MENLNGNPEPQFKRGNKITYKNIDNIPNKQYYYGGHGQSGFVGTVIRVNNYEKIIDCYIMEVTTRGGGTLFMAERDFVEYKLYSLDSFKSMLLKRREYKLKYGTTKWKLKKLQ